MPLVEISTGDLVDRVTILRIKTERIADPLRRDKAQRELDLLYPKILCSGISQDSKEYVALYEVNKIVWDLVAVQADMIKNGKATGEAYNETATAVFENNNERFKIKSAIDRMTGSRLEEVKSHV